MVTVLVVDDSAFDRRLVGGLLAKGGPWQIEYAEDGQQALEQVPLLHPDLIVTDLQMPRLNGLELVRSIREQSLQVPVILMTGQGSETIAVEALQAGASSYVPKSALPTMLVDTVGRVLSLASEQSRKRALMERLKSYHATFVLNNDASMAIALVGYLQSILADMNVLSESDRLRTGIALEEALLNAAYHGNLEVSSKLREEDHSAFYSLAETRNQLEPYRNRVIEVEVKVDQTGLTYVIRDEGPGFDPRSLPDPTDPANLERPCGRGVLLMRTFMDDVIYNDTGNQVTMVKKLRSHVTAG